MLALPEYAQLFVGLLAIVNPIGRLGTFLTLTHGRPPADKRRIALIAAAAAVAILVAAFFVGELLLRGLGITIHAFRIAGGILLLYAALVMISGHGSASAADETPPRGDAAAVAVVPLATPLLAGPGPITTVIVYAHLHASLAHTLLVVTAIGAVGLVVLITFRLAPVLAGILKQTGMTVVTRLMGLVIAATAVEFIVDGIAAVFPGLVR